MALWRKRMPKGVIWHSDRGSQYCSTAYQSLVLKHQLVGSMSAKGNCYDNACAESFFHTMKVEAIHGERFATREEMSHTVFEYIEVDYNRIRRHSVNGRMSPMAFEALKAALQDVHSTRAGSVESHSALNGRILGGVATGRTDQAKASLILAARVCRVNGFWMKCTPSSSTPWWAMTLAV